VLDANYSLLGKLSTPLQSTSLLRGTQFMQEWLGKITFLASLMSVDDHHAIIQIEF